MGATNAVRAERWRAVWEGYSRGRGAKDIVVPGLTPAGVRTYTTLLDAAKDPKAYAAARIDAFTAGVDPSAAAPEARILIYDIETAPNLGYTWGKWQQDVIKFKDDWYLLSVAWKWIGDSKAHVLGLPDFDLYKSEPANDRELALKLRELFDEADIAVTHNGVSFDNRKAQSRMMVHGITPPSPHKDVDTLRVARGNFAFTSNRLGDLCAALGIPAKAETGGFKTWIGCMAGEAKAWARMKRYNKRDILILEELYYRFRPWIPRHPNLAVLSDEPDACPRCGSSAGMRPRGWAANAVTKRRRFQCVACGGWCLGRQTHKTSNKYVAA